MTSVAAATYEQVRVKILLGDFEAGRRLAEIPLASSLGVSRPTMRATLLQLAERGMLSSDGHGLRVARMAPTQVRDALRTRAALEALSARLAAERVRDGHLAPAQLRQLAALADAADTTTRAGDLASAALANRAFHGLIADWSANASCRDALERLWDQVLAATVSSLRPTARADAVDREHRELVAAVTAGDPRNAETAARRHVTATIKALS